MAENESTTKKVLFWVFVGLLIAGAVCALVYNFIN